MPYTIRKVHGKKCYKVYNRVSKRVFSKCTDEKNAKSQLRLLRALEFNKSFVPRSVVNSRSARKSRKNTTRKARSG
jgi:hypothetical protein